MALIKCDNCGKIISDKAKKCPQCKNKLRKKINIANLFTEKRVAFLSVSVALIFIIILVVNNLFSLSLEKVKKSVVLIEVYDNNGELLSTGSGFCAFESNIIITNFHVISGSYSIKIKTDNKKEYDIKEILVFDIENDLAILKSNTNLKPLKLGNSKKIKTGSYITTIGSPMGELNTVSTGIISNADNDKGIQISAPIYHGSSGGTLFDKNYKLIGITYAGYDEAQNINYAISIDYMKQLYGAYKKKNYYKINGANYTDCIQSFLLMDIYSGTSNSNIGFTGCGEGVQKKYYSINNINTMYKISDIGEIYKYNIGRSNWASLYNNLSYEEKEEVHDYYEALLSKTSCLSDCDISSNIASWSIDELFLNLGILEREELALVLVDLKNFSGVNTQFNRVNENYPIDAAKKSLILYLLGDYNWSNIHKDNKQDIFNFFNNKNYSTKDLSAILKYLGYSVKTNSDGTLTAYWN